MKQNSAVLLILFMFLFLGTNLSQAQGCVAIRHFSCSMGNNLESNLLKQGEFQVGLNYRYFRSFRHFKGTAEEPDRVANSTEVVNNSHAWDFSINFGITTRLYVGLSIPTVLNERSSLYEHGREERHKSFSRGLADLRVGMGYWLLDPYKNGKANLSLGLGLKLPTGAYNASDIFYNVGPGGSSQVRPVDQSIQPGDGGLGFTVDFQFYQSLTKDLMIYGAGFYLFNPRETNGIRTFRETLSSILENEAVMSVPDQYSLRVGMGLSLTSQSSASLGARFEGVPVKDVLGGDLGFRRPGSVLSLDPGVSFMKDNFSLNLNVPIALRRERLQSITDKQTQQITGEPRNGDAAFADYLINFGISYRIAKSSKIKLEPSNQIKFNP